MIYNYQIYDATVIELGSQYEHPQLQEAKGRYIKIRDCLEGRVKSKGEVYLPDPSELLEKENIRKKRYTYYHQRAVWLPVAKRTQQGLVGQVFVRPPEIVDSEIPTEVIERISVDGGHVYNLANYAMHEMVATGRGALVLNFTAANEPMLDFIETEHILTWAELPAGELDDIGRNHMSVLVRTFNTVLDSDGISVRKIGILTQYRLDDNKKAWMRKMTSDAIDKWGAWVAFVVNGEHLGHLPCFPVGSEQNTYDILPSPLDELCDLNISHYINTADYEEHVKLAGQVTPVIKGLEQSWYDNNIKGVVGFGVRTPIPLGKDADAKLLQAQSNSTAKEALDKKEKQMVAVGARLIEEKQVRKTATEADIESQAYHSILGKIAKNVAEAFSLVLRDVSKNYQESPKLLLKLNTEFGSMLTDAEHRRLTMEEWQQGLITFDEWRSTAKSYNQNVMGGNSEEIKAKIVAEIPFRKQIAEIGAKEVSSADNRSK